MHKPNAKRSTQLRNILCAFSAYVGFVLLLTIAAYALEPRETEQDFSDSGVGCVDDCLDPDEGELEESDLFDGLFFC